MATRVDFLALSDFLLLLKLMAFEVIMAVMTIRNIDKAILERLRERAATHGRSVEDEAREILRMALSTEMPRPRSLGRAIHERFAVLGGVTLPKLARDVIENPCRPASKT